MKATFAILRQALAVELIGPFRPRRAMVRADEISLPIAFCAHVMTIAVGVFLAFLLMGATVFYCERAVYQTHYFKSLFTFLGDGLEEFYRAVQTAEFWAFFGIFSVIIEAGILVVAFLLMSWGAVDERLRQSWKHALRTVWLTTSLAFWWVVLCTIGMGLMLLTLGRHRMLYLRGGRWNDMPWIYRNEEVVPMFVASLAGYAVMSSLLRALSARQTGLAGGTQLCESCGYDLSHTPADSRCPECGEGAILSLDAERRRPPLWETSSRSIRTYLHTVVSILRAPGKFFKALPTRGGFAHARRFARLNLIIAGLVMFEGALEVNIYIEGQYLPRHDGAVFLAVPLVTALALLSLSGLIASTGGLIVSSQARRNQLAVAGKAALYMTAVFPPVSFAYMRIWSALLAYAHGSSTMPGFFVRQILPFLQTYGLGALDQVGVVMSALAIPVLICIVRYHMIAFQQVRYANR